MILDMDNCFLLEERSGKRGLKIGISFKFAVSLSEAILVQAFP